MEIVDVREIDILRHISDEELDEIKSVHVYGRDRPRGGLSALYITKNDQVYLAGHDSLFGTPSALMDSSEEQLGKSCKVEELSGLGVEKIVVCAEFGAALTAENDLYMWGRDVAGEVSEVFKVAVQCHYDGSSCPDCSRELSSIWKGWLSWCASCRRLQNAVSPLPHPWVDWAGPIRIGLCYHATDSRPQVIDIFCTKCGKYWIECGITVELKELRLMFCMTCVAMIDGEWYNFIPLSTNLAPHKVSIENNLLITDIEAGKNFLLIQTPSQLFVWGDVNGLRHNNVLTPDYLTIAKMSCGSSLIAVVSFDGDLYIYGDTEYRPSISGMLPMGMRKVPLKAPAVHVACGHNSVVCLLMNGTFEFIGDVTEMVSGGVWTKELALISIPTAANQKIIESTMKHLLQPDRKRSAKLTGDQSDIFIYLHGLGDKTHNEGMGHLWTDASIKTEQESMDKETSTDPESRPSSHNNDHELFGNPFLSDLTLKLSDGTIPVHRLVLCNTSVYFREFSTDLRDTSSPGVLDMSFYNGSAYRSLLKYFYRVPVGQLSRKDLFDLYILASSYNEDWVTRDVFARIKHFIDDTNVLFFYDEAKAANATELLEECRTFMNAPRFRNSVLQRMLQNERIMVAVLRSFSNTSLLEDVFA